MKAKSVISPITLREVYDQTGEFSAKVLIDPRVSQEIETVAVDIRNSDGRSMDFSTRRWGTKLTLNFKIDDGTPDGVSVIDLLLRRRDGSTIRERLSFWTIK